MIFPRVSDQRRRLWVPRTGLNGAACQGVLVRKIRPLGCSGHDALSPHDSIVRSMNHPGNMHALEHRKAGYCTPDRVVCLFVASVVFDPSTSGSNLPRR